MKKTLVFLLFSFFNISAQDTIAIQPFDNIDTNIITAILPLISKELHNAKLEILQKATMPDFAYYKPRNRYRAEKILSFLDTVPCKCTKIVGFTESDISTTKGEYIDWGIFGYGSIGGKSCVCSIYRLNRKSNPTLFISRLRKLVVHELGHTYGLDHCNWPLCVMADYKGTMASLDRTGNHFCSPCMAKYKRNRL
jgi:archaemetzincin